MVDLDEAEEIFHFGIAVHKTVCLILSIFSERKLTFRNGSERAISNT